MLSLPPQGAASRKAAKGCVRQPRPPRPVLAPRAEATGTAAEGPLGSGLGVTLSKGRLRRLCPRPPNLFDVCRLSGSQGLRAPSPRPVLVMQAGEAASPSHPAHGAASSEMLLTCLLNFVFPRC